LFEAGQRVNCRSTYEGHEEMVWQKVIKAVEPQKYFSFQWSAGDISAGMYSQGEDQTLVEFLLESTDEGTALTIRESGFDHLPEALREQAYPLNCEGWDAQAENIKNYIDQ
jgi:uncharacterized protein YndB with AHSA1/START domain